MTAPLSQLWLFFPPAWTGVGSAGPTTGGRTIRLTSSCSGATDSVKKVFRRKQRQPSAHAGTAPSLALGRSCVGPAGQGSGVQPSRQGRPARRMRLTAGTQYE